MKRNIVSAVLLLFCFISLGVLSGAIPVMAGNVASADTAAALTVTPAPAGTEEPPLESPSPADIEDATPGASPTPETAASSTPTPTPTPDGGAAPVTITSDSLIDNHTYYSLDEAALLAEGVSLTLPADGYQILIVHTHTTEAYAPVPGGEYDACGDYRTTDPAYSVVRVGDELAAALEAYGLRVLHDTTIHDYPSYNGSYAASGETIAEYLAAYPGIALVIDLHRDALGDDEVMYKTVADADGETAAQCMFVMGTDVNLEHPLWRENLKLALTLQTAVLERYDTLMRPIVVCDYRYNQQLTTGSLLLEVGTAGNTLDEALAAVRAFAAAVGPVLYSCSAPDGC